MAKIGQARETRDTPGARCFARFAGSDLILGVFLGLTPQALFVHPLCGLCSTTFRTLLIPGGRTNEVWMSIH
jgi:hypothetical protein